MAWGFQTDRTSKLPYVLCVARKLKWNKLNLDVGASLLLWRCRHGHDTYSTGSSLSEALVVEYLRYRATIVIVISAKGLSTDFTFFLYTFIFFPPVLRL